MSYTRKYNTNRAEAKLMASVVVFSITLSIVFLGEVARADCGWGSKDYHWCYKAATYRASLINGTMAVITFLEDADSVAVSCPASSMIRENIETGEKARIAIRYSDNPNIYYDDPCVPPGIYRYGCGKPPECTKHTEGTIPYFVEFEVDHGDAGVDIEYCLKNTTKELAVPYSGPVPWGSGDNNTVCIGTCEDDDEDADGAVEDAGTALALNTAMLLIGVIFLRRSKSEAKK